MSTSKIMGFFGRKGMIKKIILLALTLVLPLDLLLVKCFRVGIIGNMSASMPKGFYFLYHSNEIKKNDIVGACVDSPLIQKIKQHYMVFSGDCINGISVLKHVGAISGDDVLINQNGISVNSLLIPDTQPNRSIGWVNVNKKLVFGEYLLVSNKVKTSIDARYFGIVKKITTKAWYLGW